MKYLGDFQTKDVATRELEPAKSAYAEVEFNMMPATACVRRFHVRLITDVLRQNIIPPDGLVNSVTDLRAHDCKYRESLARLKKSKILITCQRNPFRELSSKKIFSTFKNL